MKRKIAKMGWMVKDIQAEEDPKECGQGLSVVCHVQRVGECMLCRKEMGQVQRKQNKTKTVTV